MGCELGLGISITDKEWGIDGVHLHTMNIDQTWKELLVEFADVLNNLPNGCNFYIDTKVLGEYLENPTVELRKFEK